MKITIWKKDDFFEPTDLKHLIHMNASSVTLPSKPVPVFWAFDFSQPPIGQVTDVRVEDDEIVGEVKFFDKLQNNEQFLEELMTGHRFGGYYIKVVRDPSILYGGDEVITYCQLAGVAPVLNSNVPGWKPTQS